MALDKNSSITGKSPNKKQNLNGEDDDSDESLNSSDYQDSEKREAYFQKHGKYPDKSNSKSKRQKDHLQHGTSRNKDGKIEN